VGCSTASLQAPPVTAPGSRRGGLAASLQVPPLTAFDPATATRGSTVGRQRPTTPLARPIEPQRDRSATDTPPPPLPGRYNPFRRAPPLRKIVHAVHAAPLLRHGFTVACTRSSMSGAPRGVYSATNPFKKERLRAAVCRPRLRCTHPHLGRVRLRAPVRWSGGGCMHPYVGRVESPSRTRPSGDVSKGGLSRWCAGDSSSSARRRPATRGRVRTGSTRPRHSGGGHARQRGSVAARQRAASGVRASSGTSSRAAPGRRAAGPAAAVPATPAPSRPCRPGSAGAAAPS